MACASDLTTEAPLLLTGPPLIVGCGPMIAGSWPVIAGCGPVIAGCGPVSGADRGTVGNSGCGPVVSRRHPWPRPCPGNPLRAEAGFFRIRA